MYDNMRDVYFVAYRSEGSPELHLNDKLFISNQPVNNIRNEHNEIVGTMSNILEDIIEVDEIIAQFRKDGVIPEITDRYLYCHIDNMKTFGLTEGLVVYNDEEYVVGYCGVVELEDGTPMAVITNYAEIIDYYEDEDEDDERYSITEEGLKYLKDLEESWNEPKVDIAEDIDNVLVNCVGYTAGRFNEILQNITCDASEREESKSMDNLFGNLGFGKLRTDRFKLSMNGIAVRKDGGYVVYNKETNEFVDVSNLIFDIKDAVYLLPAAEVAPGDMVIHEGLVYTIVSTKDNEIKAVSYEDCTQTVLIPKSTMFGIKYFTKVFSILGDNFAVSKDIFNNPMMLMALIDGKDSSLSNIMLMNALSKGDLASNPMALAMMLKGDKSDDSLSTLAMMSMFNTGTNPFAPKKPKEKANN